MLNPRDYGPGATVGWVRIARIFSNVISPPVIFAFLGLILSLKELPNWEGLIWAAIYGFWVSLAPILFVVYLLNTGRITDLHMNTTQERRWPYIISVLGAVIALVLIVIFNGPILLRCLALFSFVELTVLAIITNFWMISIHATSIAAADIIIGLVFGFLPALLLLPLVILVSWVRLFLRRHTRVQVLAGLSIGIVTAWIVFYLGCLA